MSSDLSDEELTRQLAELTGIKIARDVIKKATEDKLELERLRALQIALLPLVDLLEPEHRYGRYGDVCTDSSLSGAERRQQEPKDYVCARCTLLFFCQLSTDEEILGSHLKLTICW